MSGDSIGPYDPTKDMLEKMHEEDDALSEKDAERFSEEQRAMALKTAQAYLEKAFTVRNRPEEPDDDARLVVGRVVPASGHPSPHVARDRTEEYDMRTTGPNPLYDIPMVEVEGDDFEYECSDGRNLDELAADLVKPDEIANRGGIRGPLRATPEPPYRSPFPAPIQNDPKTWPGPQPADIPAINFPPPSPESMEKLKDTIEKMGQGKDGGGFRMNAGKNQIELLPEIWIWALADVMTQGSRKYPARNWEKGMDWSAMIGCMYRHLAKYQSGQRYDGKEFNKELGTTGCHELAMIAWNALALMFYDIYGLGNNDLPVYEGLDHFIRVNGSSSDLAVRWAKEDSDDT